MSKYEVKIPFAGYITVGVDADDEEDAVELAMNNVELCTELKTSSQVNYAEVSESELYDRIASGNVYYVSLLEVEVEEENE